MKFFQLNHITRCENVDPVIFDLTGPVLFCPDPTHTLLINRNTFPQRVKIVKYWKYILKIV